MLVLSRKKDEIIRIGDDIVITIVEVRGNKVRVGIVAPQNVTVHREEVWLEIQKQGDANAKGRETDVHGDEEWSSPDPDQQVG